MRKDIPKTPKEKEVNTFGVRPQSCVEIHIPRSFVFLRLSAISKKL
jgi:hypothetical protein